MFLVVEDSVNGIKGGGLVQECTFFAVNQLVLRKVRKITANLAK